MVNIKMSSRAAGWWRGLIGGSGAGQSQAAARGGRRVAFELKSSYEAKSPRALLLTLRAFYDLVRDDALREKLRDCVFLILKFYEQVDKKVT